MSAVADVAKGLQRPGWSDTVRIEDGASGSSGRDGAFAEHVVAAA